MRSKKLLRQHPVQSRNVNYKYDEVRQKPLTSAIVEIGEQCEANYSNLLRLWIQAKSGTHQIISISAVDKPVILTNTL